MLWHWGFFNNIFHHKLKNFQEDNEEANSSVEETASSDEEEDENGIGTNPDYKFDHEKIIEP